MEKVYTLLSTGLPGLDRVLTGVRPGDNIVWQVDSVDDYIPFVSPFFHNAYREGRKLIYFRFADHPSLLPPDVKAEVFHLHPEDGFENFIDEIFDKIELFGIGACYVFDSLSELAVDWYSDRMLGNFFMLTCPYLYDFETATYFALLKNHHTAHAIDAIHSTAQVVIDVFRNRNKLYIHPLKVYKRYSETMYMLHSWEGDNFSIVKRSSTISEVLSSSPQAWLDFSVHRFDSWTRSFTKAQEIVDSAMQDKSGVGIGTSEALFTKLLRMAITREPQLMRLAQSYFDLSDLVEIGKRMIGTGLIGGKSVGMLVARAILRKKDPYWKERLGAHDSFYVGSDVYYTYLILNNCWWARRKLKNHDAVFDNGGEARQRLINGIFPEDIKAQFMEMLNYFGQSPIIVRSSSLLEDAYGNAFSGKYESVFCANQGTPQQRLEYFMDAVRKVYASTLDRDALTYRAHWGLLDRDEQMALLVQRVSGSSYDKLFFPQVAGVGFSFNPYVWSSEIDPHAGVIRLVFGLGTRAVDRSEDDYTRIVSLSAPHRRPEANTDEVRKYTQRRVDVLDLSDNKLVTRELSEVIENAMNELPLEMFASRDEELEQRAREYNREISFPYILTFDEFLSKTSFVDDMHRMLKDLEDAYEHPVDIEFTSNFAEDSSLRINLVQCRPFQVRKQKKTISRVSDIQGRKIMRTTGPVIGNSFCAPLDRLVYVVPSVYSSMSMSERHSVARLVGRLTHLTGPQKADTIMLFGPGRWGTTTPSLGVPVSFAEINTVSVLCEIALMHEGLVPDISLGTHFFNDLVEMDMLYMALYPERKGNFLDQVFFDQVPSVLTNLIPDASPWTKAVKVIESKLFLNVNAMEQDGVCFVEE